MIGVVTRAFEHSAQLTRHAKSSGTALIITRGFADVLSIRNEHRYEMYDPQIEFAEPLIPRHLTFEIDERVLADGTVLKSVDPAAIEALIPLMKAQGAVSAARPLASSSRLVRMPLVR